MANLPPVNFELPNPHHERAPDFMSEAYAESRNHMTNNNVDDAAAARILLNSWTTDNARRCEAWDQREAEAAAAAAEAARLEQEERDRRRRAEEQERAEERKEAEKKQPKLGQIIPGKKVSLHHEPEPAQWAKDQLRQKKYVPLWYFTRKAILEANSIRNVSVIADDPLLNLPSSSDQLAAALVHASRGLSTSKPSRNALPDEALAWEEICTAYKLLLPCMAKTGWKEEYIKPLMKFFLHLESKAASYTPYINETLVRYAARTRKRWHDEISHPPHDGVFDIGEVEEALLSEYRSEIMVEAQAAGMEQLRAATSDQNNRSTASQRSQAARDRQSSSQSQVPAATSSSSDNRRQRSNSPPRARPYPSQKQRQSSGQQGKKTFQPKAESSNATPLAPCAVCLSRLPHAVSSCNVPNIWSGEKAYCQRDAANRITNPEGTQLCFQFQRPEGCAIATHKRGHECSGCGSTSHGASTCHKSQKVPSTNST